VRSLRLPVLFCALLVSVASASAQRIRFPVGSPPPVINTCLYAGSQPASFWATPPLPAPHENSCDDPLCGGPDGPACDELFVEEPPASRAATRILIPRLRTSCSYPSAAQCSDPSFLNACGEDVRNRCSRHAAAIRDEFHAAWLERPRAELRVGEDIVVDGVPRESMDLSGRVEASYDETREALGFDPSSYQSSLEALDASIRNGSPEVAIALAVGMESNGDEVRSCFEYAHELFYDVSLLELLTLGVDGRTAYDVAYSEAGLAYQRLCEDDSLRSRDGTRVFGRMFHRDGEPLEIVKNAFHQLVFYEFAEDEEGIDLPRELVDYVRDYVPRDGETYRVSWLWNAETMKHLRTMPRRTNATIERSPDYPCGAVRTHGYTDEELNYLYDLQQRYQALVNQLRMRTLRPDIIPQQQPLGWIDHIVNPPFASGYAVEQLQSALRIGVDLDVARTMLTAPHAFRTVGSGLGDVELVGPIDDLSAVPPALFAALGSREQRIGNELLVLLEEARRWGCLEDDGEPTPCDWSPKLFRDLVKNRFKTEQEAAYDECELFVKNAFDFEEREAHPIRIIRRGTPLSERAPYVYESESPVTPVYSRDIYIPCGTSSPDEDPGDCSGGATHFAYSGNGYDALPSLATSATRVGPLGTPGTYFEETSAHRASATRGVTLRAVGAAIEDAPEILSPTGTLQMPRYREGLQESAGNGLFGVEYAWNQEAGFAGFDSDSESVQSLCGAGATELGFEAALDSHANVRILGREVPVIEVGVDAYASPVASTPNGAQATVKVLGQSVWDDGETRTNALVGGGEREGLSASYVTYFTILGVPIRVEAGATVVGGIEVGGASGSWSCDGARPSGGITLDATPSFEVHAFASAAVDAGIARVGVKGELTVIRIGMPVVFALGIEEDVITVDASGDIEFGTLDGRLALFAEVGAGPFKLDAEKTLIRWQGISDSDELFRLRRELDVPNLQRIPWGAELANL